MLKLKVGIITILTLFVSVSQATAAQSSITEYILKGTISNAPKNVKTVRFLYYRQYFSSWTPSSPIELSANLINGKFLLRSKAIDKLGYLQIILIDGFKYENSYFEKQIGPQFLIEPSDNINVNIKDSDITFSGNGAAKYNIIYQLNKTDYSAKKRGQGTIASLADYRNQVDSINKIQLNYLFSNKAKLPNEIYKILKMNTGFSNDFRVLQGVLRSAQARNISLHDASIIKMNFKNKPINSVSNLDSMTMLNSNTYNDYIFLRASYDAQFRFETDTSNRDYGKRYSYLFNSIYSSYSGLLRQNLMITLFNDDLPNSDSLAVYFNKVISFVKPGTRYYGIFNDLVKYSKGSEVYNFALEDTSGHVHKLSDFRDKIVVLDLYYNGCSPCSELNKALKPVVERYKNNPHVVFISVNQDGKERFISAVKTGLYTHENSINLYTNGLLLRHPFIQYYGWNSAPQLMIVDKFGKVLAMNPMRPMLLTSTYSAAGAKLNPNDPGTLKMIQLIEEGLSAIR